MGLAPIHNKYFVRNLTLHHFLLSKNGNSDVITKTHRERTSLESSSTHKNLVHQDSSTNKNIVHTKKTEEEEEYSSASPMSPNECHCTFNTFTGLNVPCLWYSTIHVTNCPLF